VANGQVLTPCLFFYAQITEIESSQPKILGRQRNKHLKKKKNKTKTFNFQLLFLISFHFFTLFCLFVCLFVCFHCNCVVLDSWVPFDFHLNVSVIAFVASSIIK